MITTHTARRHGSGRDIELVYDIAGGAGEPMLLLPGGGGQRTLWSPGFCDALTERGFRLARSEHRDGGGSTTFAEAGRPNQLLMVLRPTKAAVYTLADMADDAAAVLDDLGWSSAHVVGPSMGGMVGQMLAVRHPERVRSLASISSTAAPMRSRGPWRTQLRLARIFWKPAQDVETWTRQHLALAAEVGSPAYPTDAEALREYARASFAGRSDLAAMQRQTAAVAAAGDRRAALAGITAPTLVVHGEADPMIRVTGGVETAEAIPGARLLTLPGMGHDLPRELWPTITDAIAENAARAQRAR